MPLKWNADQRMGFFGYVPSEKPGVPPQPRFRGVTLNINQANAESAELVDLWLQTQKAPGVPAYSGGVLDSWPSYAVDALAIARSEVAAIVQFLNALRPKAPTSG